MFKITSTRAYREAPSVMYWPVVPHVSGYQCNARVVQQRTSGRFDHLHGARVQLGTYDRVPRQIVFDVHERKPATCRGAVQ